MMTSRLSLGTQLALMRHPQPALPRPRFTLHTQPIPTTAASTCPAKEPATDPIYRDCVIRLRHYDLLGRWIFVALDEKGWELDRGVAASDAAAEKLERRLWELVYAARTRRRLIRIVR